MAVARQSAGILAFRWLFNDPLLLDHDDAPQAVPFVQFREPFDEVRLGLSRGKLCRKGTSKTGRAFYNLQYWHGGRNNVRYVGEADCPVYAEAVAGYREFMRLHFAAKAYLLLFCHGRIITEKRSAH